MFTALLGIKLDQSCQDASYQISEDAIEDDWFKLMQCDGAYQVKTEHNSLKLVFLNQASLIMKGMFDCFDEV